MRQVQNDQAIDVLWRIHRKLPGNESAPVVAHDNRLVLPECFDHGDHVANQKPHVVILDALRFIAQVVSALVNRDGLEAVRQTFHLLAP
jgi:hypothetical protein